MGNVESWYANYANYIIIGFLLIDINCNKKKGSLDNEKKYYLYEPYLFGHFAYGVIRRYVIELEIWVILESCHSSLVSGFHGGIRMAVKVIQSRFY